MADDPVAGHVGTCGVDVVTELKTARQREKDRHAMLDILAAECSERTRTNSSHRGCKYCAQLANYYNEFTP